MIKYEELTPEQKEIWDAAYEDGFEQGWDDSAREIADEYEADSFQEGYKAGVEAEQARIQYVLNMMFEASLNMGQGNKAVQYKNVMELLNPANFKVVEDFK